MSSLEFIVTPSSVSLLYGFMQVWVYPLREWMFNLYLKKSAILKLVLSFTLTVSSQANDFT